MIMITPNFNQMITIMITQNLELLITILITITVITVIDYRWLRLQS